MRYFGSKDELFARVAALPSDDAALRAGLIGAITLGTVVGRYLLRLEGVRDAEVADIVSVLRPAVHAIAQGEAEPAPRTDGSSGCF
ncbi:hypothetical protein [Nonomuraea sp. NPDC050643]|uniref:TetR/AcrR family transcriptional regulator n=1 Tax=Nonomuraea sp. NPDC050643 TaxID=3155660 RepID=UPI0033FF3E9D